MIYIKSELRSVDILNSSEVIDSSGDILQLVASVINRSRGKFVVRVLVQLVLGVSIALKLFFSPGNQSLHLFLAESDDFDFLVELDFDGVVDQIDSLSLVSVVKTFFRDTEWAFGFGKGAFQLLLLLKTVLVVVKEN